MGKNALVFGRKRVKSLKYSQDTMISSCWQSDPPGQVTIPVAKPRLPSFDEVAPYMRRIDVSQWYSNGGPLVQELERRLEAHIAEGAPKVATVANATLGLALALLAHNLPPGSLCMVPAWTFAATAHAIQLAGLVPWIVDVNPRSWMLEPLAAGELLRDAPGPVSAVIPVSPFGAPIELEAWESFRDQSGIAVVIDAAAAFDTIRAASVPAVVSLHATKILGVGEGGFVVSTDGGFIEEVQKRANFGFWFSREATARSFNAKMSEYSAAVGLAALDSWHATRGDFARVARAYHKALQGVSGIQMQCGFGERWVASTMILATGPSGAESVWRGLSANRTGSRRWWGGGLHRHRAFENCPRLDTSYSDALADSVIGLPCWRDLPDGEIGRICELVLSIVR